MWAIIGVVIGLIIHFFIIKPIEIRNARKWCKEHGLIPDEESEVENGNSN